MREFKEIHEQVLAEAKANNGFIGSIDKTNYAIKLDGVDLGSKPTFGDIASMNKKLKEFKSEAKKLRVDAKGKATLASVKAWVKENGPTQFFARWTPDSSSYKDDSVEIYYTK